MNERVTDCAPENVYHVIDSCHRGVVLRDTRQKKRSTHCHTVVTRFSRAEIQCFYRVRLGGSSLDNGDTTRSPSSTLHATTLHSCCLPLPCGSCSKHPRQQRAASSAVKRCRRQCAGLARVPPAPRSAVSTRPLIALSCWQKINLRREIQL